MREILFRGKRIRPDRDTGIIEWVYGHYMTVYGTPNIELEDGRECDVDPETVGQYTGLTDKNGTKIFEGDICRSKDNKIYLIKIGSFVPLEFYSVFEYEEQYITDKMAIHGVYAEREGKDFVIPEINSFVILGNIHDNPELLKESKK